jgi:small subunit ribosomal protein S5
MARPVEKDKQDSEFNERLVGINRVSKVVKGGRRFGFAALMVGVPLRDGRTIHHDIKGRYGAGKVILRAAPSGTGIIAGGPMRAVFEALGVQDVVAKAVGSSNPYNMVRATFDALVHVQSPRQIASRRSKKVSAIVASRESGKPSGSENLDEE